MTPLEHLLTLLAVLILNILGWPVLFWLWRKVSPYIDTNWPKFR